MIWDMRGHQIRLHYIALEIGRHWSLNWTWHWNRTCQYEYFPTSEGTVSFWPNDESVFEVWVTVFCGDGLPSITIVLLHVRLIGESLKTTNRNYMRGLEGREGGWWKPGDSICTGAECWMVFNWKILQFVVSNFTFVSQELLLVLECTLENK